MNILKLIEVCNYILKRHNFSCNYTKLIKILYLADKESLRYSNKTITGDNFVNMDNGPVLSGLYDLILGRFHSVKDQGLWDSRFIRSEYDLIAATERIPAGELSKFEKEILDTLDEKFKDYEFGDMIKYVHNNCPEWEKPNGSSTPINQVAILRSLGKSEEEIKWIIEDQEAFQAEDIIFQTLASP